MAVGIVLGVVGVLVFIVLAVLAVTITRERRRQVASYTPEQRRIQSIRGGQVRLEEGIAALDDMALDPDAEPAVRDGHAIARERSRQAREVLDAGDLDRAEALIQEGGQALDAGRRVLYARSGKRAPAPDWPAGEGS